MPIINNSENEEKKQLISPVRLSVLVVQIIVLVYTSAVTFQYIGGQSHAGLYTSAFIFLPQAIFIVLNAFFTFSSVLKKLQFKVRNSRLMGVVLFILCCLAILYIFTEPYHRRLYKYFLGIF